MWRAGNNIVQDASTKGGGSTRIGRAGVGRGRRDAGRGHDDEDAGLDGEHRGAIDTLDGTRGEGAEVLQKHDAHGADDSGLGPGVEDEAVLLFAEVAGAAGSRTA
jgi:hypothetical protein